MTQAAVASVAQAFGRPSAAEDAPVTVLIRRRVKPGCEPQYEDWLHRLQAEARSLPGYLGVTTQAPPVQTAGPREYLSAVRFATLADLRAFEVSELRERYLREVQPWVLGDAAWESLTGLELWFSAPPGTVVPQPSRVRMALVMIVVVYALVLSIGTAVNLVFELLPVASPAPLRLLLTIAIEVVLMTWWLMPWITRRLAPWIYPQRKARA